MGSKQRTLIIGGVLVMVAVAVAVAMVLVGRNSTQGSGGGFRLLWTDGRTRRGRLREGGAVQ